MMKTCEIATMKAAVAKAVRELLSEPVVLTENGTPVAVLLPVENADLETISLSLNPQFLTIIERSRKRLYTEGGLSTEEVRRRLGIEPSSQEKLPSSPRKRKKN